MVHGAANNRDASVRYTASPYYESKWGPRCPHSYETYEIIVLILLNQEQKPSFCPRDLILFAASGIFEMQRSMEHAKK